MVLESWEYRVCSGTEINRTFCVCLCKSVLLCLPRIASSTSGEIRLWYKCQSHEKSANLDPTAAHAPFDPPLNLKNVLSFRARLHLLCRRPPRFRRRQRTARALGGRRPRRVLPLPPAATGATQATASAQTAVAAAAAAAHGEAAGATATAWRRSRPSSTRSCGTLASRDELTTPVPPPELRVEDAGQHSRTTFLLVWSTSAATVVGLPLDVSIIFLFLSPQNRSKEECGIRMCTQEVGGVCRGG